MPTKPNKAGNQQNYVPKGNGEASGEYGDNATGSNIHYFAHFKKQVNGQVENIPNEENISKDEKVEEKPKKPKKPKKIKTNEAEKEELKLVIDKKKEQPSSAKKKVDKYDDVDCYDFLLTQYNGEFDEEKIKSLSSEELHSLVLAKYEIENNTIDKDVQKKYKKLTKFINDPENGMENIWNNFPKTPEDLENSLKKKKDYFENSLNNPYIDEDTKPLIQAKLDKVNEFKELTGKLLEDWEKSYNDSDSLKKLNEDLVSKFYKLDNPYSQISKNKALWFKSFDEAYKYLEPNAKKIIGDLNKENPEIVDSIKNYTGSYSFINEPLRKIHYFGNKAGKSMFINSVKNMTKGIDKSVSKENMWLQRGVSQLNINGADISSFLNSGKLEDLVGTTFEDQGFVSCGTGKGTGFSHNHIIMNIYAPKGTKMMYVAPISHYKSENETIIQRGYSYKITKTESKNGKIYLDCEVVLGSDSKKYDDKQLQEIADNYYSN